MDVNKRNASNKKEIEKENKIQHALKNISKLNERAVIARSTIIITITKNSTIIKTRNNQNTNAKQIEIRNSLKIL